MGSLRNLHPDPRFIKSLVEEKTFENDTLVVTEFSFFPKDFYKMSEIVWVVRVWVFE
jgi:hypothetical protein